MTIVPALDNYRLYFTFIIGKQIKIIMHKKTEALFFS